MKNFIYVAFLLFSGFLYAQDYGYLSGSFETHAKWYVDDAKTGDFTDINNGGKSEYPVRANSYLEMDYTYKKWTAGLQLESYYPKPLLSYSPKFDDSGISTFYAEYRSQKLKITAGYFYEQFGSGLVLRSWEDRALGINNALRGGRITYRPTGNVMLTALYGRQKEGFDVSEGRIFGFNTEMDIEDMLHLDDMALGFGFSYVGRYQDVDISNIQNPDFDPLTNAFSLRFDFSKKSFYLSGEYVTKGPDVVVVKGNAIKGLVKTGNALLFNLGYAGQGLGINATFRRLENMAFFSDRLAAGNDFNQNIVNFIPALTKQHDYLLTNIYVYQAQPMVNITSSMGKAGEIGGQLDLYYSFKEGSSLGGKYGTKLALNASYWSNLQGTYSFIPTEYQVEYFNAGDKYFSDISLEVRKRLSPKLNTIFTYLNQYYSKTYIEGKVGEEDIKTDVAVAEVNYRINQKQSMRFVAQHLWTQDGEDRNWVGGTLEFNVNRKLSVYVSDIYNYGNMEEENQTHYYNVGGSYTMGATRLAVNYGRQRGGVVCVGGVCRYVPPSTGLSVNLSILF